MSAVKGLKSIRPSESFLLSLIQVELGSWIKLTLGRCRVIRVDVLPQLWSLLTSPPLPDLSFAFPHWMESLNLQAQNQPFFFIKDRKPFLMKQSRRFVQIWRRWCFQYLMTCRKLSRNYLSSLYENLTSALWGPLVLKGGI